MKQFGIVVVLTLYLVGCAMSQHYTAHGTVVETDHKVVTVSFPSGHEFSFYADEGDYSVGDRVTLKMNTSGTDDYIFDDYIENAIK